MNFHEELKATLHVYVKLIYKITKNFPKEEIYGIVSQIRRAAVSVILNYIEGFARRKGPYCKVYKNFLEISYGSLKESEYLLFLSYEERYIVKEEYDRGAQLTDKIGGMLWSIIKNI